MEATKSLARKLRNRPSWWKDRRGSVPTDADVTAVAAKTKSRYDAKRRSRSNPIPAADPLPPAPTHATVPASRSASGPEPATAPTTAPTPLTANSTNEAPDPNVDFPSPGSDLSPFSQPPPPKQVDVAVEVESTKNETEKLPTETITDYFTLEKSTDDAPVSRITFAMPSRGVVTSPRRSQGMEFESTVSSASNSTAFSPRGSVDDEDEDVGRSSMSISGGGSRHSSITSVAFQLPNKSLPQGRARTSTNSRHRNSSPNSPRYRKHVAFSNVGVGEATKRNFPSYTLVVRHLGYQPNRRSRTFMVGTDQHQYSDEALQWLFDRLVDEGDEIVCVRVVEKDVRMYESERRFEELQKEANDEAERIKSKCPANKAISVVLEFAVGKLHSTFQRLIRLHHPSMLIVGTRGRTLGGIQGLMASRNSFSKYCLQYSPIPVVVVRPDEKRQKKKEKRDQDPEKQSYRQILQSSKGIHEADSDSASAWEIESKLSPDEEAGKVAKALGLPSKFDPTIKKYKPERQRSMLSVGTTVSSVSEAGTGRLVAAPTTTPTASAANSEDEGSGDEGEEEDEGEGEFEAVSGAQLLQSSKKKELEQKKKELEQKKEQEKKARLHKMEVGEAAALLKNKPAELDEDDEDEDDEDGGGAVKTPSAA